MAFYLRMLTALKINVPIILLVGAVRGTLSSCQEPSEACGSLRAADASVGAEPRTQASSGEPDQATLTSQPLTGYSFFTFTIFMLLPDVFSALALNSVFRASLTAFAQIWEKRM